MTVVVIAIIIVSTFSASQVTATKQHLHQRSANDPSTSLQRGVPRAMREIDYISIAAGGGRIKISAGFFSHPFYFFLYFLPLLLIWYWSADAGQIFRGWMWMAASGVKGLSAVKPIRSVTRWRCAIDQKRSVCLRLWWNTAGALIRHHWHGVRCEFVDFKECRCNCSCRQPGRLHWGRTSGQTRISTPSEKKGIAQSVIGLEVQNLLPFGFAHEVPFQQRKAEKSRHNGHERGDKHSWTLWTWWRKMATVKGVKRHTNSSRWLMSHLEKKETQPCLKWLRAACVFIQSILPLGKYERHCAATCSRLLTSATNLFRTSFMCVWFFLSSYFSVTHFATLFVTAHTVQSSPMDRSSQTTLCSGFRLVFFLVLFCFFPWCVLACWASATKQKHLVTPRTQSLVSWLFFPALDDDSVFLWDKMKTLPFTFVLLLPSQFVYNVRICWIFYRQKHKTNCILFFFLAICCLTLC